MSVLLEVSACAASFGAGVGLTAIIAARQSASRRAAKTASPHQATLSAARREAESVVVDGGFAQSLKDATVGALARCEFQRDLGASTPILVSHAEGLRVSALAADTWATPSKTPSDLFRIMLGVLADLKIDYRRALDVVSAADDAMVLAQPVSLTFPDDVPRLVEAKREASERRRRAAEGGPELPALPPGSDAGTGSKRRIAIDVLEADLLVACRLPSHGFIRASLGSWRRGEKAPSVRDVLRVASAWSSDPEAPKQILQRFEKQDYSSS